MSKDSALEIFHEMRALARIQYNAVNGAASKMLFEYLEGVREDKFDFMVLESKASDLRQQIQSINRLIAQAEKGNITTAGATNRQR